MNSTIQVLKELLSILDIEQRRKLAYIQFLLIVMAFAEMLSLGLVIPFATFVMQASKINDFKYLVDFFSFFGITSEKQIVLSIGLATVSGFIFSNIFLIYANRVSLFFSQRVGAEIAVKLYKNYLEKNYIYHTLNNPGELSSNILLEVNRITHGFILPILNSNQRIVLILAISAIILITYPLFVLIVGSVVSLAYYFVYKTVKIRVSRDGKIITVNNPERVKLLNEGFGGIKDLKMQHKEGVYINAFKEAAYTTATAQASIGFLGVLPKYLFEMLFFISGVLFILYKYMATTDSIVAIIPFLSFVGMCAIRLLPSFQQVYASVTQARGNVSALWKVSNELRQNDSIDQSVILEKKDFTFNTLRVENLSFSYFGENKLILDNLNFKIKKGSSIGFVGTSGSGKTTLMNVLTGLIEPDSGTVYLDNLRVETSISKSIWSKGIGYVSQDIYLADRSIAQNIAFGIPSNEIDMEKVNVCSRKAHIDSFINSLDDKYDQMVGERGIQLSGGQRQRLAIARALYNDPQIIIFDEGTSALDNITEKKIISSLELLRGEVTVLLVAHRLSTVERCDNIFMLHTGKIIASGTYEELINSNEEFKKMVNT